MFKRGYVYEVCENGEKMHPVVVMEDAPSNSQFIKAVAFTHNEKGTSIHSNQPFPKEYVIKKHAKGMYKFQWQKTKKGSTSIITDGFLKTATIISPKHIGRIKKCGLKWIEPFVGNHYVEIQGHIYNARIN